MSTTTSMNLILLVVFIGVFYFLMIRPQQKKDKAMREMLAALRPGDEVVTIGGIKGVVVSLKEDFVVLDIATGRGAHTKVEFLKSAISTTLNKNKQTVKDEVEEVKEEEAKGPTKDKKITPKKLVPKKAEKTEESEKTEE